MTRVTRGITSQKRKRSILKAAKGYRGQRSKKESAARDALKHAGAHAFAHRKDFKNVMRNKWNTRINTVVREMGSTYSVFIKNLKSHNILLDRKVLATMAESQTKAFTDIFNKVK